MDLPDLVLGQADRDELGQPAALADNPHRAVAGVYQGDGCLDDPAQHHPDVEVGTHRDHGLEQGIDPVARRHHSLQPDLQLIQQLIEPEVRQHRPRLPVTHRLLQPSVNTTSLRRWPRPLSPRLARQDPSLIRNQEAPVARPRLAWLAWTSPFTRAPCRTTTRRLRWRS